MKLQKSILEVSSAKSEITDLKKKVSELEEIRRNQSQETRKLQNETERESKRDREMLQEKNNSLNKEITRLTMLLSQNSGETASSEVDTGMLDRIRAIEAELDDVSYL